MIKQLVALPTLAATLMGCGNGTQVPPPPPALPTPIVVEAEKPDNNRQTIESISTPNPTEAKVHTGGSTAYILNQTPAVKELEPFRSKEVLNNPELLSNLIQTLNRVEIRDSDLRESIRTQSEYEEAQSSTAKLMRQDADRKSTPEQKQGASMKQNYLKALMSLRLNYASRAEFLELAKPLLEESQTN